MSSVIISTSSKSPSIESLGKPVAAIIDSFLKSRIYALTGSRDFPGMQPVSLDREKVIRLLSADYHVCEKSDGIRVLGFMIQKSSSLGTTSSPSFFITDRKYEFREIEGLAFPTTETGDSFHNETLVDGELVVDTDSSSQRLSLYLFDLLTLNGQSMLDYNLLERFNKLWKGVIRPWDAFYKNNPQPLPFRVVLKENFKAYHISHVLKTVGVSLCLNLTFSFMGFLNMPLGDSFLASRKRWAHIYPCPRTLH